MTFRRFLFLAPLCSALLLTGTLPAQDMTPVAPAPSSDGSTPSPAPASTDGTPVPDTNAPPAPMAPPAPAPDVAPSPIPAAPATPAPTPPPADEPVARAVPVPKAKFTLPARDPAIPEADYIGHRFSEPNDSGGWGWVKLPTENWKKARWVTLLETPGVAVAPWRGMGPTAARTDDQNYEYKMRGFFAPYQVYDPHTNEMLDVFVLESYETIGPAQPLSIPSGPADRMGARAHSGFSSKHREDESY